MFVRMSRRKKGMSDIVVSILLVVLSLIAVSLLWVYVSDLAKEIELGPAFSCLEMQLNPVVRLQKACYNSETGDIELRVLRIRNNLNLKNIYFVINGDEVESKTFRCGEDCLECDVLEEGRGKNYYVNGESGDVGGNVVLRIFGCGVDEKEIEVC